MKTALARLWAGIVYLWGPPPLREPEPDPAILAYEPTTEDGEMVTGLDLLNKACEDSYLCGAGRLSEDEMARSIRSARNVIGDADWRVEDAEEI